MAGGGRDVPGDVAGSDDRRADLRRPRQQTIQQGDRRKAYRPLDEQARREALEAALAAYERGDYFEAHELLEPAWMGSADLAERALYQGLIKLAAAYVHRVRGNPTGMSRNLTGARQHLLTSARLDPGVAEVAGIDIARLVAAIAGTLDALAALAPVAVEPPPRYGFREPVAGVPDPPRLRRHA